MALLPTIARIEAFKRAFDAAQSDEEKTQMTVQFFQNCTIGEIQQIFEMLIANKQGWQYFT